MVAGRKPHTYILNDPGLVTKGMGFNSISVCGRNLPKSDLGGVIFGCKRTTIRECLVKQLFGLPAQHFSFVKNIYPGMPLFLFNYSDRKLHGVFEAASNGQMNINPYGWSTDGREKTSYPAQVQVRVKLQCQTLNEDQFRPVIADNYYVNNHFWFELDVVQTNKLICLFTSVAIVSGTVVPKNISKWRAVVQPVPPTAAGGEGEVPWILDSEVENSSILCQLSDSTDNGSSFDGDNPQFDSQSEMKEVKQEEKELIFLKLKEYAGECGIGDESLPGNVKDNPVIDTQIEGKGDRESFTGSEEAKKENPSSSSEHELIIAQLMQEIEDFKAFKAAQTEKNNYLEQKLVEAEMEIQLLKRHFVNLESASDHSIGRDDIIMNESSNGCHFDLEDSIFLIGGFDGKTWLPGVDIYNPSQDVIKSLKPMSSVRAYASVVQFNGELYVIGGGDGSNWYNSVESYNHKDKQWTLCPSLSKNKGSLAGAVLNNKIFVVGGGNGLECFSDVEMLDLDIGQWIPGRSMLQKRFAVAAIEVNGILYATGGFDGNDYLQTSERFDPREHSWRKIANMNTKRGCHTMVALNEKLYALGGFDGNCMINSVEVFDPRLGTWMEGEPMKHHRGYTAAGVVGDSVYVIGGVRDGEGIVDTVESYAEGQGWKEKCTNAVGKRCFMSAIVMK